MLKRNTKSFYTYELTDGVTTSQWRTIEFYYHQDDTNGHISKREIGEYGLAMKVMEITIQHDKVNILGRLA